MDKKQIAAILTVAIVGVVSFGLLIASTVGESHNVENKSYEMAKEEKEEKAEQKKEIVEKQTKNAKPSINKTLQDNGLKEKKKSDRLSKALSLMGMSYGQISRSKIKEIDEEGTGVYQTVVKAVIKGGTHTFSVFYDDNKEIYAIYDEEDVQLYGYTDKGDIKAVDVNKYYPPAE